MRAVDFASVAFSQADLAKAETALSDVKNGVPRAISGAINKTLAKAKTQALRGLTNYLTIKRANLARRVYVRKATTTGSSGSLKIMGRPIGLINFAVKDTRDKKHKTGKGVMGQVIRGGPNVGPNDDFIATGKSGNEHVFMRVSRAVARLPIEADYSETLFKLYTQGPVKGQVEQLVAEDLPRQLDSQIDRFLHIQK